MTPRRFFEGFVLVATACAHQQRVDVFMDCNSQGYCAEAAKVATNLVDVPLDEEWPSYGRTLGFGEQPPANLLQKAKIVRRFDNERFYKLYVDLMTRPVPVRAKGSQRPH